METASVGLGSEMLNFFDRYLAGCCTQLNHGRGREFYLKSSQLQVLFFLCTNQCQTTEQCVRLRLFLA